VGTLRRIGELLGLDDPWRRPRPSGEQVRRDVWLGLGAAVLGVVAMESLRALALGAEISDRLVESYVWTLLITLPLALRRVLPITTMLFCSVVFYVMGERVMTLALSVVVQVALFMAIYAAWAWTPHRRRLVWATGVMVVGMFAWLIQALLTDFPESGDSWLPAPLASAITSLGINVAYFFGAIAWGLVSYRDARRRSLIEEQNAQLRAQQEREAERAVADERLRIARDLHDVVAHHVTGIGIQAAAARHVLTRDPAKSAVALEAIESSSRGAVDEMHRMVGLLRSLSGDGGSTDEGGRRPSLADLEAWATDPTTADPQLRWRVVGTPLPVPEAIQSSLVRIAQEAVANVRQHSTAREAEIVLRYVGAVAPESGETERGAVELEVLDGGRPRGPEAPETGRGFGLRGIRERAEVHGGTAETGPRPDGGWRVRVRLPLAAGSVVR